MNIHDAEDGDNQENIFELDPESRQAFIVAGAEELSGHVDVEDVAIDLQWI